MNYEYLTWSSCLEQQNLVEQQSDLLHWEFGFAHLLSFLLSI